MSKLDDYKKLLNHIKNSQNQDHLVEQFPGGFGQFTELLLPDNINSWATSNKKYFEVVQEIKKEFQQSNQPNQFDALKTSLLTSFYTPPPICQTIVDRLPIDSSQAISILEPSAGTGNFIRPLLNRLPYASITAIEKDLTAFYLQSTT